jgi:hypothetical protein
MTEVTKVEDVVAISDPSQPVELADEYRYVTADLRRIGIIAVAMLAVLINLALFLP